MRNITWQRPKTTKCYLQPSGAERIFTLWREGKIIMGENEYPQDISTAAINKSIPCSGIWVTYARCTRMLDFRNATFRMREDGIPVHAVTAQFAGFEADIEAFCDTVRKCTAFIKLTVTNRSNHRARERVGIVVRSGKEQKLVYGAPDGYCTHAPEVAAFTYTPNTFVKNGNILRDGLTFVGIQSKISLDYSELDGILWAYEYLEPGESYEVLLSFGKGEHAPVDFDYEAQKALTVAYWKRQLARLCLPDKIQNDPEKLRIAQCFTAQLLQCYAYYVGKDFLVPRQGALQRFIWVWDQLGVLEAISRLGDFADLYRGALSTYFDVMQKESGEVCTFGENWATDTGCALHSLCTCALNANDAQLWSDYRENAYRAFRWIAQKRRESEGMEGCVPGLFPPMRGSDALQVFQNWKSDVWNLFALEEMAKAATHFDDDGCEVRAEYEAYFKAMKQAFDVAIAPQKDSDVLHIPIMPIGDDSKMIKDECYFYLMHGVFLYSGLVEDKDIPRVLLAMEREGISSGDGLYGHMCYRHDGDLHVWYTTAPELYIFRTFLKKGMRDKAEEILHALLTRSTSEEYLMCERIADNDPWFVPWMPNASGMGRTLSMLLDLNQD